MHHSGFARYNFVERELVLERVGATALVGACARLLLSADPAPSGAGAAARRCQVIVVPPFQKGANVTKRRRRRATAAIKEKVQASCDPKRNGFAASLKARGRGATLNGVTGKNISAPHARLSERHARERPARQRALAGS